jgi:hypothetical protein
MAVNKPAKEDIEKLNRLLNQLKQNLEDAVKLASDLKFTSHERILTHLLSHVQTLKESIIRE